MYMYIACTCTCMYVTSQRWGKCSLKYYSLISCMHIWDIPYTCTLKFSPGENFYPVLMIAWRIWRPLPHWWNLFTLTSHTHTRRPNNPAMSPAGPGASSYFNQPPEETQMESVIQPIGLESVLAVILPHLKDFDKLLARTPEVSHLFINFEHTSYPV